jgi:2-polyprenyl-6-methoxyphenol hydroxylase-like FAD-dependent oxidoreductase
MRVGVVGCGVGGMAAALALARRGHEVTLLEAFAAPRPLGSGLLLQPTGLAALKALGLDETIRAAGARVDRLEGHDTRGRQVMDLDYGDWRLGAHGVGIHRAVLFDTLHDALAPAGVTVVTDARILGIENPAKPVLHDDRGRAFGPFDLAVVADGSGSALRTAIRPGARAPVYTWGAVWTNATDTDGRFAGALRQVYHRAEVMTGVLPVGRGPEGETNQVSIFWSLPVADVDAFLAGDFETWRRERLAALWPQAAALLEDREDWGGFSRALYRDVSVGRWSREACVLLGDAAHGTSPQLGQGANLALVDAVELAARLGQDKRSTTVAVRAWQGQRRRHTGIYQLVSKGLTPLFQAHSAFWPLMRDLFFTPMSRWPGLKQLGVLLLTGTLRLGRFPPETRP